MSEILEETVEIKKIIGEFKTKEKFIEFVGARGNIQFIANEAFIEAKYLSGLDFDGIMLKLTICDEGTVNFEEVGTDKTTREQRERLLDIINEKTASFFNKKMIVDLPFKSVKKIKDQSINLYLSVVYQTPIAKLASIFDDSEIEASETQSSKLDDLFSMFNEESTVEEIGNALASHILAENEKDLKSDLKSEGQKAMEETFNKMKEEKVEELKKRVEHQNKELKNALYQKSQAESRVETVKTDLRVLESRLESLQPPEAANGCYFFVSEQQNEKVILEDSIATIIREKISKVKSINADAFMALFEQGEYQIRLATKIDDKMVEIDVMDKMIFTEDISKHLSKIGIGFSSVPGDEKKLVYFGDLTWHDIVDKMLRCGFSQDGEFDKMCGSNSYSVGQFAQTIVQSDPIEEKFLKLAEYTTSTDIIIIGTESPYGKGFEITDDETSFDIYQDGKRKTSLGSFGFGSVMDLEEYKKLWKEKGQELEEDGIVEGIFIPNFSGVVGIGAIDNDGKYHKDFKLNDYIQHQCEDYCDVVINIPSGFKIIPLNEGCSLPTSVIWDIKIDKVVNENKI